MYYYGDKLLRSVLGDQSNGTTMAELIKAKDSVYRAYCSSVKCTQVRHTVKKVVKTNVKYGDVKCPDCRDILLWKRETNYRE